MKSEVSHQTRAKKKITDKLPTTILKTEKRAFNKTSRIFLTKKIINESAEVLDKTFLQKKTIGRKKKI